MPSSLGVASHRSVGTCTCLLVANPFLPLGLGIETSVQRGGLAACVLTHADKRLFDTLVGDALRKFEKRVDLSRLVGPLPEELWFIMLHGVGYGVRIAIPKNYPYRPIQDRL